MGIKIVRLLPSRNSLLEHVLRTEKLLLTVCNVHTQGLQYLCDLFVLYQTILPRTIDDDYVSIAQIVQLCEFYLLYFSLWYCIWHFT